jgi:hypothetical protein
MYKIQKDNKSIRKILLTAGLIIFFAGKVFSQACCTAGTPLLGSLNLTTVDNKTWQFGLTYEYNSLKDIFSGSQIYKDRTRERISQSLLLEVNYGLSRRVTITALLSFVDQQRNIDPNTNMNNELTTRGVGDMVIMAKYNFITLDIVDQRELAFGTGLKIPLGSSDLSSNGILLPADMQPGTGSWDGIFWGYFSQGYLPALPMNLFANVSFRVNTTNKRFGQNNSGYKFGNELIANLGLGYRTDSLFDFTMLVKYRTTFADEFDNDDIPNTGGHWVYAVPGLNLKFNDKFTTRLSAQFPFYRNVNGIQLTTTFTASVSILYSFDTESNKFDF